MMLGDKHNIPRAGAANGLHPLVGIKLRWVEDGGVGCSVAPFAIEKCVGGEVDDDAEFEILPVDLLRRRLDLREVLGEGQRHTQEEGKGDS